MALKTHLFTLYRANSFFCMNVIVVIMDTVTVAKIYLTVINVLISFFSFFNLATITNHLGSTVYIMSDA